MGWGYWKVKWWHFHNPVRVWPFLPKHNSSPVLLVDGWTREGVSYIFIFSYIYIYMNVCTHMRVCMHICVCIYTHIQIYSAAIWFNWARFCSCFVWKTAATDPSALTCLEWNIVLHHKNIEYCLFETNLPFALLYGMQHCRIELCLFH